VIVGVRQVEEKKALMDPVESRHIVEQYWEAMNTHDWSAVGRLLHDDLVLEWPQSDECIRGRENFAAVNGNYPHPGPWRFHVSRIVADEHGAASDVAVSAPALSASVITFFEVRDGRIRRMTEYWPDPFEAAAWRAQWVERIAGPVDES
jgi:ketosteroid isomerase-like protein